MSTGAIGRILGCAGLAFLAWGATCAAGEPDSAPGLTSAPQATSAAPESVKELEALRQRLRAGGTHRTSFRQESYSALMDGAEASTGLLTLTCPLRLRWDYREPSRHSLIVRDRRMALILPEDRTAYVGTTGLTGHSPLTFLTDPEELTREFLIQRSIPEEGKVTFRLLPRTPRPDLDSLEIQMSAAGELEGLTLLDPAGNRTRLTFTPMVRIDPEPGWDRLVVPAGYDCLDFSGMPVPCPEGSDP